MIFTRVERNRKKKIETFFKKIGETHVTRKEAIFIQKLGLFCFPINRHIIIT